MGDPDGIREEIREECLLAFKTKKLPKIDVELKHVYVEIFQELINANRFTADVWPLFELLEQMGEIEITRRKPGPWRFKDGLNGRH